METQTTTQNGVDVTEVHEITKDVMEGLDELSERMSRAKRAPSEAELKELVAAPGTRLLVARDEEGAIIGTLTLATYRLPSGVRVWIEDVAVRRLEGGRGIGGLLVDEAVRLAKESGATTAELIVNPHSTDARGLFQRMGFGPYDMLTYQAHLHD